MELMFTSWHMGAQKCKCAQCTLLTYTYIHNEKVSGNVTVKLHEGSVSATERHPIWCSIINNWHSNITTIISIDVTVYGKNAHSCAMQQFLGKRILIRSISSSISWGLSTGVVYFLFLLKDWCYYFLLS